MNKIIFKDISEISDSREILAEKPQKFVSFFAYILIVLLAIAFIWAFFGEIDTFVRASGEVRPNESVSTIRSTFSGRVLESQLEEGTYVQSGDILLTIDVQHHLNTMEILERQYESIVAEIDNLILFRESILMGENLFDFNDVTQIDFYFRYQRHVTEIDFALEQIRNTNLDIARWSSEARVSSAVASESRNRANSELNALRSLLNAIERGESTMPRIQAEQYRRFADYQVNIAQYENLIAQRTSVIDAMEELYAMGLEQYNRALEQSAEMLITLELLYEVGGIARIELDTARFEHDSIIFDRDRFSEVSQNEIDNAHNELSLILLERERFTNEIKLYVLQGIANLERQIADFDATIQSAESVLLSIYDMGYSEELVRERHRLDMLSLISDTLLSQQSSRDILQMEINSLRLTIDESQITAQIDGVISMLSVITPGDFIQAGTDIATIIPISGGEHRVLLAVSNADIAEVEVGQEINFRFAALPFADYGEMPGRITRISPDARAGVDGQNYFLVEAEMESGSLFNRHGVESHVRVGMMCEARVITGSQRIIHWVLERLDFIN